MITGGLRTKGIFKKSNENIPLITIITVARNADVTLEKTILSVINQTYKNTEYIIIDGASTDSTLDIIRKHENSIDYWMSQHDKGIYDAMNKGVTHSCGDFICFMNCGDFLVAGNVLEIIAKKIMDNNICSGSIIYTDYSRKELIYCQPDKISYFYLYVRSLCHQSLYIGKDVFIKIGNYDLNYKILSDYEHTLRAYRNNTNFFHCECVSCDYMSEGFSELKENKKLGKNEKKKIRNTYFTQWQKMIFLIKYRLTFPLLRKVIFSDISPLWLRKYYRKIINQVYGCKKR